MIGQNLASGSDGRRGIPSGVCASGKNVTTVLYSKVISHLSRALSNRGVRTYARNGTIFMHCSFVEADLLMSNRPHILLDGEMEGNPRRVQPQAEADPTMEQSDRRINLRRILPQVYGLTQIVQLTLHDPPQLAQADVCARLAVALGGIGKVNDVVSVAPDRNTYMVTFQDYDSVDVLILLCISQRDMGASLPVSALPGTGLRSPSRLIYNCRPSTTALSHLLRVGPPNLSAVGLMSVPLNDDTKLSSPDDVSTSDGSSSRSEESSISSFLANRSGRSLQTASTRPEEEICSPVATTSSINHDDTNSTTSSQPRPPKRLRTSKSDAELLRELKKELSPPSSCVRIKSEIQPSRSSQQAQVRDESQQTSAPRGQRRQHWELHKFIGGKRCAGSIDLGILGFPIPIGRDPLRAKIQVEGPSMQHVSRLHVELHETNPIGEPKNSLRLNCHSSNGTVVDGVYVKKGDQAEIYDGSTFILGDVSFLEGSDAPNQELRFTLHRVFDEDASKENYNGTVHRNTTTPCGTNFETPKGNTITISDSEEEQDTKPNIKKFRIVQDPTAEGGNRSEDIFNEVIILSDDDDVSSDENSKNNQFQQLVMKFKDEPTDEEEEASCIPSEDVAAAVKVALPAKAPLSANAPLPTPQRPANVQIRRNRLGSVGSPLIGSNKVQEGMVPSDVSIPTVVPFGHSGSGTPTFDLFKLNVKTSERLQPVRRTSSSSDSSARPSERGQGGQVRVRRRSSPSPNGQPSSRLLPQIRIGFDAFRRCLLDLRLNSIEQPQRCQSKFINYVKYGGIPTNTSDLARLLFSCFCLEASARVEIALCRRNREIRQVQQQQQHQQQREAHKSSVSSALISQKQVAEGVLRVRLIAACNNGAGRPLESASMVLLHVACVRRGGKQLRSRSLLGLVYSSERKDRRDRSGTVAVPEVLAKSEQVVDVVDDVLVDMNAFELEGLQLQIDHLFRLERLCEVNELRKVVSMRQMPPSCSLFLLGPPYSSSRCAIWSPQNASEAQTSPSDAMQRAMTRIARTPKLSSEESVVVCAALSQILSPPTEHTNENTVMTAMLVQGAAGSGKTATLQEIALQTVLSKPQETVLIFCKWPQAADQVALQLYGLIESRGFGDRFRVTRTGKSRHPSVLPLTLTERVKQAHARDHEGSLNRLKSSVGEMQKLIEGLRHSLEDQLTELSPAVKRKKLQEIAQFEKVLFVDKQQLAREEKRLHQDELIHGSFAARRRRVLESSNILVCGYVDVETSIIGYAFEHAHGRRFSLVLMDQAQEISTADLVPLMQLPVSRFVFFGDRFQSSFCRPKHTTVRNTDLLKRSAFERMLNACPQKVFYLRTQWRLPGPLAGIVNAMFYGGRLRSMRDGSVRGTDGNGMNDTSKLAALTMINVSTTELLSTRDLPRAPMQMIRNVVEALAPHSGRIQVVLSFASVNLPASLLPANLAANCEAHFIGPDLLAHGPDPDVVVLPLFNKPFVDELSRLDPPLLCSIMTRPGTSLVIVGHLTAAGLTAEKIEELVQRAKRANRYINEKPAWLTGMAPHNLSQYLMQ